MCYLTFFFADPKLRHLFRPIQEYIGLHSKWLFSLLYCLMICWRTDVDDTFNKLLDFKQNAEDSWNTNLCRKLCTFCIFLKIYLHCIAVEYFLLCTSFWYAAEVSEESTHTTSFSLWSLWVHWNMKNVFSVLYRKIWILNPTEAYIPLLYYQVWLEKMK